MSFWCAARPITAALEDREERDKSRLNADRPPTPRMAQRNLRPGREDKRRADDDNRDAQHQARASGASTTAVP